MSYHTNNNNNNIVELFTKELSSHLESTNAEKHGVDILHQWNKIITPAVNNIVMSLVSVCLTDTRNKVYD